MLAAKGVTCMRLMLEYCQVEHRYLEDPVGQFAPNMIRLWDDLFSLCERHGIRILLTPYDTFWMWIRWQHHPYRRVHGGPCEKRNQWLLCANTREAIKRRLAFATERWGGSGALFAWDIWNEIHPAHAGNEATVFADFVTDIGGFLRQKEMERHGRAHPQTVSVFGPVLNQHPLAVDCAFRHPSLDFASVHFYESKTIDHPRNTVDAAISTGRLTAEALAQIRDGRPFFDSEHGPIHLFKDKKKTLPELFDDEYFRHMQWAHFASGGAGGGMRWPNRHPHSLTAGMRQAQQALAAFLPLIDWHHMQRTNWNSQLVASSPAVAPFGCGNERQAILWLLRKDSIGKNGMLRTDVAPLSGCVHLPIREAGRYRVITWCTRQGQVLENNMVQHEGGKPLCLPWQLLTDMAVAVVRE